VFKTWGRRCSGRFRSQGIINKNKIYHTAFPFPSAGNRYRYRFPKMPVTPPYPVPLLFDWTPVRCCSFRVHVPLYRKIIFFLYIYPSYTLYFSTFRQFLPLWCNVFFFFCHQRSVSKVRGRSSSSTHAQGWLEKAAERG